MCYWNIYKKDHNTYVLTHDGYFINFKLKHTFSKDYSINIIDKTMSNDSVIFIKNIHETDDKNSCCIGSAYKYNYTDCEEESLIDAKIISSNISDPKKYLEGYFA